MIDAVRLLWNSTENRSRRFNLTAESTPPAHRRKFLREEVGERCDISTEQETRLALDERTTFEATQLMIAEEAADVLVTPVGTRQAHGISLEMFIAACAAVGTKNDLKTHQTHQVIDKKITRKPKAATVLSATISGSTDDTPAALQQRLTVVQAELAALGVDMSFEGSEHTG